MSDTKTKSESAKADGSSAAKSTPDKSTSESESASDTGAPDKIASEKSKSDGGGKSARESAGGSKEVHYGYFSNIKTPEYRSGWDAIWGKGKSSPRKKSAAKKSTKTTSRKSFSPVRLNLDIDELPADLRQGLANVARAKLKKSRINYDKREAAGAVEWQIKCWVKRV